MFTGIVEEVGRIARIGHSSGDQHGENRRITVTAEHLAKELKTGDSVSVSGVCLTALDIKPGSFCADLAPETWERTSFSRLHEGALVNLELPMKADGRFGGHIVQGHVDGVGTLVAFDRIADSDNWWLDIALPDELMTALTPPAYRGQIDGAAGGLWLNGLGDTDRLLSEIR